MTGQDAAREMRKQMPPEQQLDLARNSATAARALAAQAEEQLAAALSRYNKSR